MAHSYLIFDFGADEEAAQQARHKIEGWKQGFRLGNKILLKFERQESEGGGAENDPPGKEAKAGKKSVAKQEKAQLNGKIRLLVRLDFSAHEKLLNQRWLDRIPAEEPFKSVKSEIVRSSSAEFAKTADLFDSLD